MPITIPANSPTLTTRPHHIGLGKRRTGTKITVLIDDRDIRVLDRDTGNSSANSSETGCRPKPCLGIPVNDVPRHDIGRADKERKREGLLRRRTRPVGKFEYRVTLPGDLRADEVEGSLAYGVLKLHVPKAQSTKHSKINVTESGG